MIPRRAVPPFAVSILVACVLAGCTPKSAGSQNKNPARPQKTHAQIVAEMQQKSVMSQKGYNRIVDLQHKTSQTHQISNGDFAWTLSLLKATNNPFMRARAMTALTEIRPMSSTQKAQAFSVIAPYLNDNNVLDMAYAKRVQTAIQQN